MAAIIVALIALLGLMSHATGLVGGEVSSSACLHTTITLDPYDITKTAYAYSTLYHLCGYKTCTGWQKYEYTYVDTAYNTATNCLDGSTRLLTPSSPLMSDFSMTAAPTIAVTSDVQPTEQHLFEFPSSLAGKSIACTESNHTTNMLGSTYSCYNIRTK
ncbi:PREDICTED: uncharacterized protein LOC106811063 [Priapulus caudatus]|uniref:Uncharacterized protein LOC106811063 n=1 Tax=Priapulus caudatus TaxID=37621 RepID=A0ABM1ED02_PRICU|nr:PREDICTED: uncharacterized protein LOC106811063 [Priapulus caudatus]